MRLPHYFAPQWAIKIRRETRKAQVIPRLVELLKIDHADPVIRAAAIAIRNLCVDSENKKTYGKAITNSMNSSCHITFRVS